MLNSTLTIRNACVALMGLAQYLRVLGNCWVVPAGPRLVFVVLVVLLIVVLVIVGAVTKAQASQTNTQVVILNLLNGQQHFGVPHIYQGDDFSKPTSQWPTYYGPNNASQYWSLAGIKSNQPVLELVLARGFIAGAMFWGGSYSGDVVKITIIGTFSKERSPPAVGFVIYLFLKPTRWGVSPRYNYTISYISASAPSPDLGDAILPQSSTPYIMVGWDPYWQTNGLPIHGAPGQWDVWIVSNINGKKLSIGPNPSPNLGRTNSGWLGIGTGYFNPKPGDRIRITVTYDPSTNMLTGVAYDMNTGQWASFTLNLTGYYTPPSNGTYVFGVGSATSFSYANWALLHVAMTMKPAPSPSLVSTWVEVVVLIIAAAVIVVVVVLIVVLLMIKRGKR